MNAGDIDRQFSEHVAERNVPAARLACILVAGLMPGGIVLDIVTQPGHVTDFFLLRVLSSALSLAALGLTYTRWGARSAVWLGAAPGVSAAAAITVMIDELGGYASPYYAGIALCILGIGLVFLWTAKQAALVCSIMVGVWLLPTALRGEAIEAGPFFNNLYFLALTAVIAVTSNAMRYSLAQREYAAQAKLAETTTELRQAHTKLQQLDKFKSEFFANITHELKTPLTMILASLELMLHGEMGTFSESQRSSLQSMLRSGAKLMKLINDLLDLSRLDESRLRLQIAEHDLVSYLHSLVAQVHSLAQRKSIQLSFEADVASCRVFCDLERLERVFVNLLSNAAKFTPPNGSIVVRLREEEDAVCVTVRDTGIGFPPEMAGHIFERFVQVDMAGTRKYGGTGIGLSLASELVHLHGGKITAESSGTDAGSTFTVELRKGKDHFPAERIDRRTRHEDRAFGNRESDHGIGEWQVASQKQFRFIEIDEVTDQRVVVRDTNEQEHERSVLVVEDTPDVIRVIHLALRSHFRILAAPGGAKGLELAIKHSPDLIITDLMMPDVDGMTLTRQLRGEPRTRHIPIVMLTARDDVEDRTAGMEAGVNAYLTKPFSTKELVSTIRGLMRIQETSADLVLSRSMDSLQTIAGGLAHEINNPLNYIKNALALIQVDSNHLLSLVEADASPEGLTQRTNDAIDRMSRMFLVADTGLRRIGDTVELMQRYSREGFTRIIQPFDVTAAIRDVTALLQTGMKEPVIVTNFEGGGEILCVPEEFNQVLTNLVQNALDALPEDRPGRVEVRVWNEEDALCLTVTDNGCGITPEQRGKIFTPFYTTKEVGKGMGLGLSIVWRVVTSIGGTVQVASQPGEGTEFKLRLPLSRTEPRSERRATA